MLPLYTVTYDIQSKVSDISKQDFQQYVEESVNHVKHLMGVMTKGEPTIRFSDNEPFSVRVVLSVSFGKEKAEHLDPIAKAIGDLIAFELTDCQVRTNFSKYQFA